MMNREVNKLLTFSLVFTLLAFSLACGGGSSNNPSSNENEGDVNNDVEEVEDTNNIPDEIVGSNGARYSLSAELDVTFKKPDFADWTNPTYQDQISANLWLTRADEAGIFNIKTENSYAFTSPQNTLWALGNIHEVDSVTFIRWKDGVGSPGNIVGKNLLMMSISDNVIIEFIFTEWTKGENHVGQGGGFSYRRQALP